VRGVALWDITCLEETEHGVTGYRLCNVQRATKKGRAMLKKELSSDVYNDGLKTGSTSVMTLYLSSSDKWQTQTSVSVDLPLGDMLKSYLKSREASIMVAWNMNGHDRHVLRRAVGDVLDLVTTWDALPWFRAAYTLPKNTMSSCKAGTPRSVFDVPDHGSAHSSLSDTVHMRHVVQRAAYCIGTDREDMKGYRGATQAELFAASCREIEATAVVKEWVKVSPAAWIPGIIPASVSGT